MEKLPQIFGLSLEGEFLAMITHTVHNVHELNYSISFIVFYVALFFSSSPMGFCGAVDNSQKI